MVRNLMQEFNNTELEQTRTISRMSESQVEDMEEDGKKRVKKKRVTKRGRVDRARSR